MNISFVMGVYNNLHLTKKAYEYLRKVYPNAPVVISSGGSTDGTKDWLESLDDDNLSYFHDDDRLSFSDTYNAGIKLVDTEKLVLIHNDMVIGNYFLENIEKVLTKDMFLNYTTIEPPIFASHQKGGKVIKDFGSDFNDFDENGFDEFVERNRNNQLVVLGASFFIAGYKDSFLNVGLFDGITFFPAFCEDDDFIIRAKLKGFKLLSIYNAMVYHFVSKTSRFSEEYAKDRQIIELRSNINFVRKWGISSKTFNQLRFWEDDDFKYPLITMGLYSEYIDDLIKVEPYFDKLKTEKIPKQFINDNQKYTNFDLRSKFVFTEDVDVLITQHSPLNSEDFKTIEKLRLSIPHYEPGVYKTGNLTLKINTELRTS